MITILADLAAEDPVGPGGVAEDQRDQHDRAYEHEYLAAFRLGRLPDRDAARNDVRPHRDGEPDHRPGEHDEREQERHPGPPPPDDPPQGYRRRADKARNRHSGRTRRGMEP